MEENENKGTPMVHKFVSSLMYVSQVAWMIISPIVFCMAIGYVIDDKIGNSRRIYTLVGILVGVYCALRSGITLFKEYIRDINRKNAERYNKKDTDGSK